MRVKAASITSKKRPIEWRSLEPSRLETFSGVIFAFAITLIMLSLEVPKSFTELFERMKGLLASPLAFYVISVVEQAKHLFLKIRA